MLLLIKLGGAVLTDKRERRRLREDAAAVVSAVADAVKSARAAGVTCVLVHGAGSFGHFEARAGKLNSRRPEDAPAQTAEAVAACRASLALLNGYVLDILTAHGLPAVTVPIFPYGDSYAAGTADVLGRGFLPILHGDPVLLRHPAAGGVTTAVVSGDAIIAKLAAYLPAIIPGCGTSGGVRVVFITGAAGVFTADPTASGSSSAEPTAAATVAPALIRTVMLHRRGEDSSEHEASGAAAAAPSLHLPDLEDRGLQMTVTVEQLQPLLPQSAATASATLEQEARPSSVAATATATAASAVSAVADVTGGILGKVREAVAIAAAGGIEEAEGKASDGDGLSVIAPPLVSIIGLGPGEHPAATLPGLLAPLVTAATSVHDCLRVRGTHFLLRATD